MSEMETLDERQLAERAGVDVGTIHRYTDLGLLEPAGGVYMTGDVARIRLVGSCEEALEQLGVYRRLERPPAMVFLDLSGYTQLTEERGDEAAADLADMAARISSRAGPSEVLVTEEVKRVAAPERVRFDELGPADLKGFSSPVTLLRAAWA